MQANRTSWWMASLTLLLPVSAAFAQVPRDLVVNGGFESPALGNGTYIILPSISGWTAQSGCGIEIQNHTAGSPMEGAQLVELDSDCPATISQVLPTVAGHSYLLSFGYSPRPGVSDNRVRVLWGNQVLMNLNTSGVGLGDTRWQRVTLRVKAPGNSTRLTFVDTSFADAHGGYIDAVSVIDACQAATGVPTLDLNDPSEMTLEYGVDTWLAPGAQASDACGPLRMDTYNSRDDDGDGVPGAQDKVAGDVNGWVQGSYTLTEPENNTAVPVTRTVNGVNCSR